MPHVEQELLQNRNVTYGIPPNPLAPSTMLFEVLAEQGRVSLTYNRPTEDSLPESISVIAPSGLDSAISAIRQSAAFQALEAMNAPFIISTGRLDDTISKASKPFSAQAADQMRLRYWTNYAADLENMIESDDAPSSPGRDPQVLALRLQAVEAQVAELRSAHREQYGTELIPFSNDEQRAVIANLVADAIL